MEDLTNCFLCCIAPKKESSISSITEEKIKIKETEEDQNKKKIVLNPSSKLNRNLRAPGKKKLSIISKYSNKSNITFSNSKVRKTEEENRIVDTLIIGTHELELEGEIFFNKNIIIDRVGLKKLGRKNQNGITIFGVSDNPNDPESGIDFNLNLSKNKIKNNNKNNIPLFSIEYDKNEEHFILNLLHLENKMLLYIDYNFLIENNTNTDYIIGKIPITIISPKTVEDKFFFVIVEGKKYKHNKYKDCPITIGRTNSTINIKNDSISKNHAVIDYHSENQVICIYDTGSTNGTFFIIGEKCPFIYLLSDLTFKLLEHKFKVKINYI